MNFIKAILFDIDGTILNCKGAGKKSLIEACRDVFGTSGVMHEIDFQGKTDPIILHESLQHMGFSENDIHANSDALKKSYFDYLEKNISKENTILFPGIKEILELLAQDDTIIAGILTGNYYESAAIKLGTYDLNSYFSFGAYGDDAKDRNGLPPVAKQRIADSHKVDVDFTDMIIIGDTVLDIACADSVGARSIIVGTGWSDRETLLAHNPDFYFDDLSDTEEVMSTILK